MSYRLEINTNLNGRIDHAPIVTLVGVPKSFVGHVHGYKQPSVLVNINLKPITHQQKNQLMSACQDCFGQTALFSDDLIETFVNIVMQVQKESGMPVFEGPKIHRSDNNQYEILFPTLFHTWSITTIQVTLEFFNFHLTRHFSTTWQQRFKDLMTQMRQHAPQGSNSIRFLQAAHSLNIPWRHVALNTFQYGHGKHARWLDSSLTDQTSYLSASMAFNKHEINSFLFRHGFPVPPHFVVANEMDAIKAARQLGFPVVVKPLDDSGGQHVYLNIKNDMALREHFNAIKKIKPVVLIEKKVKGKDYRLVVFQGKLIFAIERVPAHVIGDGANTIEQLVLRHNQKHLATFPVCHLAINNNMLQYLKSQALSLTTVPKEGEKIFLSPLANISHGATPVACFENIHPDTARLVEEAAKLLRLDLVGIDFVSPDIAESYLINSGMMIEVNVKPHLGMKTSAHLYKQILLAMLPDEGRVPIIVVYGKNNCRQKVLDLLLEKLKKNVAVAKCAQIFFNNNFLRQTPNNYLAGQAILMMKEVASMVYCIDDINDIALTGLPFDRFNHLIMLADLPHPHSHLLAPYQGKTIALKNDDINTFMQEISLL